MQTDEERMVAILHDVLEDWPDIIELDGDAGVFATIHAIRRLYGFSVEDAVVALTRAKGGCLRGLHEKARRSVR